MLVAPLEVTPGSLFAARAVLLDRRQHPPMPVEVPIRLELRAGDRSLTSDEGGEASFAGVSFRLRAPEQPGTYRLRGEAQLPDGERAAVERQLRVSEAPRRFPARRRFHDIRELSGALELRPSEPEPWRLEARVVGGGCQPEHDCEVIVWLGAEGELQVEEGAVEVIGGQCSPWDGASVQAEGAAGTEDVSRAGTEVPEAESDATPVGMVQDRGAGTEAVEGEAAPNPLPRPDSFHRCVLRIRSQEAHTRFVALRDGHARASRRLQLPLAMGAASLRIEAFAAPGQRLPFQVQTLIADAPFLLETHQGSQWTEGEAGAPEDIAFGDVGLWRLSLRQGFFAATSGSRVVAVAGDPKAALRLLVEHDATLPAEQRDPFLRSPTVSACLRSECDATSLVAFAAAAREAWDRPWPPITSGAAQADAGIVDAREDRRSSAALLIFFAGLLASAVVIRRGLGGVREAGRVMQKAQEAIDNDSLGSPSTGQNSPPSVVPVYGAGVFVLSLFAVVAAMVLSRGCL